MSLIGGNVVVAKLLAAALPVPVVLFLRCAIGALLLAPLALRGDVRAPTPRMLGVSAAQALCGTLLYNSLLMAGLRRTGALPAGLVLATLPAVVAVGAALLLRETLPARRWAGVALAAVGLMSLALARNAGSGAADSWSGDALVLLAVCGEASYVLLTRVMAVRMAPLRATFWLQICGFVLMAPLAVPRLVQAWPALREPRIAALLLLHAATASVLCNLLWFSGMRRVPASLGGVLGVFLPGAAAVAAVLVLGERFTPALAAGFALMLVSILLATWPARVRPA
jgi:drug/metabolite transporter (DMT)-like permease